MGSTVTCAKLAAAFAAPDATIFYVLYEQTYEKNCYPHTPHWSCTYFGPLDGALERIFACAASCESGMLQGRSGWILPETYIKAWMKELAAPRALADTSIQLWSADSYRAPIPPQRLQAATEWLAAHGLQEQAEGLANGRQVYLSLHQHAPQIRGLLSMLASPAWTLIDDHSVPLTAEARSDLGYKPSKPQKRLITPPEAMALDENARLLQRADGSWFYAGWAYSIVGEHIREAWQTELSDPGSYLTSIPAIRHAMQKAAPIPAGTTVRVSLAVAAESEYHLRTCEKLRQEQPTQPTNDGFEIAVTQDNTYHLGTLGADCATWVLPNMPALPASPVISSPAGTSQPSLF